MGIFDILKGKKKEWPLLKEIVHLFKSIDCYPIFWLEERYSDSYGEMIHNEDYTLDCILPNIIELIPSDFDSSKESIDNYYEMFHNFFDSSYDFDEPNVNESLAKIKAATSETDYNNIMLLFNKAVKDYTAILSDTFVLSLYYAQYFIDEFGIFIFSKVNKNCDSP